MKNIRQVTELSALLTISIVLAIIEQNLLILPIQGVKVGLANIVILIALYLFKPKEVITIMLMRIFIVGLFSPTGFGPTFLISLSGGISATAVMLLIKKANIFGLVGVSVLGAVGHSLGQIMAVRFLLVENNYVYYYLPFILLLSIPAGVFTGLVAGRYIAFRNKEDSE